MAPKGNELANFKRQIICYSMIQKLTKKIGYSSIPGTEQIA